MYGVMKLPSSVTMGRDDASVQYYDRLGLWPSVAMREALLDETLEESSIHRFRESA